MKHIPIVGIIRIIIIAALLYGVYTETGIWTTVTLLLISISIELKGVI
jgi:hypothetical protein